MKYDQHENCAKCGYPEKTVEYAETLRATPTGHVVSMKGEDFLMLKCSRCGYQWIRDCLDKEEA